MYKEKFNKLESFEKIYLENSVGIGEHPQHLEEIDKLFDKIATATETAYQHNSSNHQAISHLVSSLHCFEEKRTWKSWS